LVGVAVFVAVAVTVGVAVGKFPSQPLAQLPPTTSATPKQPALSQGAEHATGPACGMSTHTSGPTQLWQAQQPGPGVGVGVSWPWTAAKDGNETASTTRLTRLKATLRASPAAEHLSEPALLSSCSVRGMSCIPRAVGRPRLATLVSPMRCATQAKGWQATQGLDSGLEREVQRGTGGLAVMVLSDAD